MKPFFNGQEKLSKSEIIKFLRIKVDEFSRHSLPNVDVQKCYDNGGVLAGGCFLSMVMGSWVRDYDLFFPSPLKRFLSLNTTRTKQNIRAGGGIETIAFHEYKSPQELIETFDFSCTQIAYDGKQFYFGENTIEDINNRYLRLLHVNGDTKKTLQRIVKYIDKGFEPDVKTLGVLCKAMKNGFPDKLFDGDEYAKFSASALLAERLHHAPPPPRPEIQEALGGIQARLFAAEIEW